tara:strand:+ start:132 stop:635 length:504 start_codon:yes stop_codon:yes gene_type:complete
MANPLYGQNKFDNSVDNISGEIKHIVPGSDGTHIAGAETVILTSSDAGNRYFVNISANTASFRLPSAYSNKGMEVHFHLDINSDAEATKDLDIFTDSTAEFIIGSCLDAGAVHDSTVADDLLRIDTSAGAAGGGDRISLVCDGLHWYVTEAVALSAGAFVSGTATRS